MMVFPFLDARHLHHQNYHPLAKYFLCFNAGAILHTQIISKR